MLELKDRRGRLRVSAACPDVKLTFKAVPHMTQLVKTCTQLSHSCAILLRMTAQAFVLCLTGKFCRCNAGKQVFSAALRLFLSVWNYVIQTFFSFIHKYTEVTYMTFS